MLCCAWSPDSKFVVTGGEDDAITVWQVDEPRAVCTRCCRRSGVCLLDSRCMRFGLIVRFARIGRGVGHTSFVSAVAFDPVNSDGTSYRIGSGTQARFFPLYAFTSTRMLTTPLLLVAQDTRLLLWDFAPAAVQRARRRGTSSAPNAGACVCVCVCVSVFVVTLMLAQHQHHRLRRCRSRLAPPLMLCSPSPTRPRCSPALHRAYACTFVLCLLHARPFFLTTCCGTGAP